MSLHLGPALCSQLVEATFGCHCTDDVLRSIFVLCLVSFCGQTDKATDRLARSRGVWLLPHFSLDQLGFGLSVFRDLRIGGVRASRLFRPQELQKPPRGTPLSFADFSLSNRTPWPARLACKAVFHRTHGDVVDGHITDLSS